MPSASDIVAGLTAVANEIVLGGFGVFYGAFGVLRLGVWLDVVLLAGAMYLLTYRRSTL